MKTFTSLNWDLIKAADDAHFEQVDSWAEWILDTFEDTVIRYGEAAWAWGSVALVAGCMLWRQIWMALNGAKGE
jgi:hypothetical protein